MREADAIDLTLQLTPAAAVQAHRGLARTGHAVAPFTPLTRLAVRGCLVA